MKAGYHHGDLRNALLAEGVELAREGGPDAVAVREAARRVGVSHNAAYRHFSNRDDYLGQVAALGAVELGHAMERALLKVPGKARPVVRAWARLRATGEGYIAFALDEPGLFRAVFSTKQSPMDKLGGATAQDVGPFQHLIDAVDGLVDVGAIAPERRPRTELVAWSGVHGIATLVLDGPLRGTPREEVFAIFRRFADVMETGA